MPTTLIRTKLQPPKITTDLVERPLLIQRLNKSLDRKLALVSAPAGFGKSTLVVSWLAQVELQKRLGQLQQMSAERQCVPREQVDMTNMNAFLIQDGS